MLWKIKFHFCRLYFRKVETIQSPKYLKSLHGLGHLAWQLAARCGSLYRQCTKEIVLQYLGIGDKPCKRMGSDIGLVCFCHENYIFGHRNLLFLIVICNFVKLQIYQTVLTP